MKIIKMKKIGLTLLITLVTSFSFTQVTTEVTATQDREGIVLPIEGLITDVDFKRYLNNLNALASGVADKEALIEMKIDEEMDDESMEKFAKYCGLKSSKAYSQFVSIQSNLLNILDKRYAFSKYEPKDLQGHLLSAISTIEINDLPPLSDNCKTIYDNTMLTNTVVYASASTFCHTLDLAIYVAGICHAAAFVQFMTSNNNATNAYNDCLGN
jgi:hypothetical protein